VSAVVYDASEEAEAADFDESTDAAGPVPMSDLADSPPDFDDSPDLADSPDSPDLADAESPPARDVAALLLRSFFAQPEPLKCTDGAETARRISLPHTEHSLGPAS